MEEQKLQNHQKQQQHNRDQKSTKLLLYSYTDVVQPVSIISTFLETYFEIFFYASAKTVPEHFYTETD